MRHIVFITVLVIIEIFFVSIFSHDLQAQTIFSGTKLDKTIGIEILKPDFADDINNSFFAEDVNNTFLTSAIYFSANLPFKENMSIALELPFAHAESETFFGSKFTNTNMGNPLLGVNIWSRNAKYMLELGMRIPWAPESSAATAVGFAMDYIDRMEAFSVDVVSIYSLLSYTYFKSPKFSIRLRGGPILGGNSRRGSSNEIYAAYGIIIGYSNKNLRINSGVSGRIVFTEYQFSFNESSFHQFGLKANTGIGKLRPGISLRVPLDNEFNELLDLVFGFDLTILLQQTTNK